MEQPIDSVFLPAFFIAIGFAIGLYTQRNWRSIDYERDLARYRKTYVHKEGYHEGYGGYTLYSFDGGLVWHAVEYGPKSELIVMGHAEIVYPGLLAELANLEALSEYTKLYGEGSVSGDAVSALRSVDSRVMH